MKFRDAAKHFKMVIGAELIPWNIDAIKGNGKCYITEGEIDALSLIAVGLEEVVSVPYGAGGANLQWLDRFVESHLSLIHIYFNEGFLIHQGRRWPIVFFHYNGVNVKVERCV